MVITKILILLLIVIIAIDFSSPLAFSEEGGTPSDPEYLSVGYAAWLFSEVDIRDAQAAIEIWAKEIVKSMGKGSKPKALVINDLESIVNSMKNKEVDLAAISSLDYLSIKDKISIEPVLVGKVGEKVGEEYVLLVRQGSGTHSLEGLKGKIINVQAVADDSIPLVWLNTLLQRSYLPESASLFKRVKKVSKPSQAVLPVFFSQVDAALVTRDAYDTMVELNPQIGQNVVILTSSPLLIRGVLVLRKDMETGLKERIIEGAINLSKYPRGNQILKLFLLNQVVPYQPNHIANVQDIFKLYNKAQVKKKSK